jgi:hypothetical protein
VPQDQISSQFIFSIFALLSALTLLKKTVMREILFQWGIFNEN